MKNNGFTIIELIITVILIAILAAVGTPLYLNYIDNSKFATVKPTFNQLFTSLKVLKQKEDSSDSSFISGNENIENYFQIKLSESVKNNWDFYYYSFWGYDYFYALGKNKRDGYYIYAYRSTSIPNWQWYEGKI